jgi:hypothetical protein
MHVEDEGAGVQLLLLDDPAAANFRWILGKS